MANIYSMTAFGRATASSDHTSIECELKTLNNRYLEINLKLPDAARSHEAALRERVKKQLSRGKLEVFIRINKGEQQQLAVNTQALQALNQALATVGEHSPSASSPNQLELLRWPGILDESNDPALSELLINTFNDALNDLSQSRQREGEALAKLVLTRVSDIRAKSKILEGQMPALQQKQHQRLLDKMAELDVAVDPARLEQELVVLANKSDVAEELDRLYTHCDEIERIINAGGACGRRLDFMMQELNREANTLGSKAVGTEVTQTAVDIKVLIEQMREQIQNIE